MSFLAWIILGLIAGFIGSNCMLPEGVRQQPEDVLRFWRVIPPAASTLNRCADVKSLGKRWYRYFDSLE